MYLLDTNICIYIINKRSENAVKIFENMKACEIKLSSITLAELEYGVSKSQHRERNRRALLGFVSPFEILPFDDCDAEIFGLLRAFLENTGRKIEPYDMQIAAQALGKKLTLVTNNVREFERIPDLEVVNWAI
jgi:tRNA(fMet)-specific endonuclease VapC